MKEETRGRRLKIFNLYFYFVSFEVSLIYVNYICNDLKELRQFYESRKIMNVAHGGQYWITIFLTLGIIKKFFFGKGV